MTAYDEMRRGQDEWDNELRRQRYAGHGDILDWDIELREMRKIKHKESINGNPTGTQIG